MLGAIIGDIVGSRFERRNRRDKNFELFTGGCAFTDDSVMTAAIARALMDRYDSPEALAERAAGRMRELGRIYPDRGFGGLFRRWLAAEVPQPYNSFGNGAAMRVSPCAWAADSLEEALRLSRAVTAVTHNHPEGIKGAEAAAAAIFLAREGKTIAEIRSHIERKYYRLDFTLDQIRPSYRFDASCQGSVPQAIEAFCESSGFEDTIRGAVSIGGDSDTVAAIAGSIAEAYYGIPSLLRECALTFLDDRLTTIVTDFEALYPPKIV